MSVLVVRPGAFTTVQDLGRPGFGAAGVPPSGAMDELACRAANLLVGNEPGAAVLEITIAGPELRFADDHVCALAGAPFGATVGDDRVRVGRRFKVPAGATLAIDGTREGVRCYLAFAGGIATGVVLGSRSTFVGAGLGGVEGRALRAGDEIPIGPAAESEAWVLPDDALPRPGSDTAVRAIPGPQEDAFEPHAIETFFSTPFRVSPSSDRAGVRLEGPVLGQRGAADLDPEGVVTGAVQVPGDGTPIVLGPDRPATGGYVKIATVITADLPLIAQARPGATLRFVRTDVETARAAWRERLARLATPTHP